jgi:hypothetical protein
MTSSGQYSFVNALQTVKTAPDLLDVIDAVLAVHRGPEWLDGPNAVVGANYAQLVLAAAQPRSAARPSGRRASPSSTATAAIR